MTLDQLIAVLRKVENNPSIEQTIVQLDDVLAARGDEKLWVEMLRQDLPGLIRHPDYKSTNIQNHSLSYWLNQVLLALTRLHPLNDPDEEGYLCPISLEKVDAKSFALTIGYLYNEKSLVEWYNASKNYDNLHRRGIPLPEFDQQLIMAAQRRPARVNHNSFWKRLTKCFRVEKEDDRELLAPRQ